MMKIRKTVLGSDTGGWLEGTDISEKHTATIFTVEVGVKMKTFSSGKLQLFFQSVFCYKS